MKSALFMLLFATAASAQTSIGLSANGGLDYPLESQKVNGSVMPAYGFGPAVMFHDSLRTYYIAALYDTRTISDNTYTTSSRTYRYLAALAQMRFGMFLVGAEYGPSLGATLSVKGNPDNTIKSSVLSPLLELHAGLGSAIYSTPPNILDAQFAVSYRMFDNGPAWGGTEWLAAQLRLSYLFNL